MDAVGHRLRILRNDIRRHVQNHRGTIAPGGGCPFNFFTSRKWSYTDAGLSCAITTRSTGAAFSGRAQRFEGKTNARPGVALSR